MKLVSRLAGKTLTMLVTLLALLGQSTLTRAEVTVETLHRYSNTRGVEVANLIPVNFSDLSPLLPAGYTPVPASELGIGSATQGIVVIVNFRGTNVSIDGKKPRKQEQVAIDVGVLVVEPELAEAADLNIPGAFHFYALAIYTDDARYAASLRSGDMPVEFVSQITYQRDYDDESGVGELSVKVPAQSSPFMSFNEGFGYALQPDPINAVFWHDGREGTTALHFLDDPFRRGEARSKLYTEPQSRWHTLFSGSNPSTCATDPETGFACMEVASVNLRYDNGAVGELLLFVPE